MFSLTVFKLPKMDKNEIKKLLSEQMICRIAFKGKNYPYLAPFQYVLIDESLYFHFTDYGKKMKLLENDKKVCVEIEKHNHDLSEYYFVVFRGDLEIVENSDERTKVINKIVKNGKQKLSSNFLTVHGIKKEEGWDSITPKRPMIIFKLNKITEKIALKLP